MAKTIKKGGKTAKKTKPKPKISATIRVMGRVFQGGGDTIEKAVASLKPTITRAPGVIVLTKGNTKREKILRSHVVNRAFGLGSPSMKSVGIGQIAMLFNKQEFE